MPLQGSQPQFKILDKMYLVKNTLPKKKSKERNITHMPEAQLSLLFGNEPVIPFVAAHFVAIFVHGYF